MLVQEKPTQSLSCFLSNYCEQFPVDRQRAKTIIQNALAYERKKPKDKSLIEYFERVSARWYASLAKGNPDYRLYDEDYYFTDLWLCWAAYSRKYVRSLSGENTIGGQYSVREYIGHPNAVVDIGCGIGYSTAALKQLFPRSNVYGVNLPKTKQYEFCKKMSQEYRFNLVPNIESISEKNGLVFASEYFEHIESPINHLEDIIKELRPRCFLIANSFNTWGLGHFTEYKHNTKNGMRIILQEKVSRLFNKALLSFGYKKIRTKLWNNKPALYVREP